MARQYNATGNSRHRDITVRLSQRAVDIDPGYARAWALLAISQANKRLTNVDVGDTGWAAAERALALQPDLAEAHAAKGRILGDAGRYDEAMVEHATALRLDPDGYEVNCAAARCYIGMRRNDERHRLPGEGGCRDRNGLLGARHGDPVLRSGGRRRRA